MNNLALKGLKIDNSESKQNNYNNKDMNPNEPIIILTIDGILNND